MSKNRRFHILMTGATIVLMIVMVWSNVLLRSRRHFKDGERYLQEEKFIQAITSYESSAHAYTPWNNHVARSLERLWEIGQILEKQHEDPTYPLVAYRSLRSSVYAVRSFYTPNKEWISRCDVKIAELVEIQRQQLDIARKADSTDL